MITAIVDLQFGSTGKGLLAGYLSLNNDYDVVVSANMPNAGHTFVDHNGEKWVHKVLPSGVYSNGLKYIGVGPGAVFKMGQLSHEIAGLREQGIMAGVIVHEAAAFLRESHTKAEQESLSSISSTMQGSMEAAYEKMRRQGHANVAANCPEAVKSAGAKVVSSARWNHIMQKSKNVLVEGSQGYSLGINAGFYPYCTSRDCTVWRLLADAGVSPSHTREFKVIGSARVHPIRVGNTTDGYSGPFYPDQQEITWQELGQTPETTTVTGRIRRVFTFSQLQIEEAMRANRVDEVFLNFCNYDHRAAFAARNIIDRVGRSMRSDPDSVFGVDASSTVRYMGFGPAAADVAKVGKYD